MDQKEATRKENELENGRRRARELFARYDILWQTVCDVLVSEILSFLSNRDETNAPKWIHLSRVLSSSDLPCVQYGFFTRMMPNDEILG